MSARLYTLSLSHSGAGSKLALERKGVDHEVVELPPGLHPIAIRALGFRGSTVPALKIDGVRVQGSLEIVQHLERVRPEPGLYPADPQRRRAVEQAESWGESTLQPIPRRLFRFAAAESLSVRRWLVDEVEGMPLPGLVARTNKPIVWVMCRKAGVTRDRVEADLEGLPALLDRADALVDEGTIGGAEPNAADGQILSSIASLAQFTDLAPLLAGRSANSAAERLLPTPPGPVPEALPRQWLDAATAATRRAWP